MLGAVYVVGQPADHKIGHGQWRATTLEDRVLLFLPKSAGEKVKPGI